MQPRVLDLDGHVAHGGKSAEAPRQAVRRQDRIGHMSMRRSCLQRGTG
jgi:hypothetical protein